MIQTDPTTLVCRHTPGPWEATGHHIFGPKHKESKHPNGRILVGNVVRGTHRADPQLDGGADRFGFDSEADVALIACAPSLLEAAKKAMLFMEDCFEIQPPDDHEIEIYNALRGAVAGAGGFAQETHWWQGPCICACCQHRWQGVVEIHISRMSPEYGFECPNCHEMKGGHHEF